MSEEKKPRTLSASEQEIETLKKSFAGNEFLLKAIRKMFLGFKINKTEVDMIRQAFSDENVKTAFRKKLFPTITADAAIGESQDYWFGTDVEIIGKDPDTIRQVIESKYRVLTGLRKAFDALSEPKTMDFQLEYSPAGDSFGIELLARNKFIKAIETGLTIVKVIAGDKNESVEEAKKRMEKDSSK